MTDYTDLHSELVKLGELWSSTQAAQMRFNDVTNQSVGALWNDNAALRDELHAVANRLENLTAFVTSNPAEVAARIVNDANRGTLREVRNDD